MLPDPELAKRLGLDIGVKNSSGSMRGTNLVKVITTLTVGTTGIATFTGKVPGGNLVVSSTRSRRTTRTRFARQRKEFIDAQGEVLSEPHRRPQRLHHILLLPFGSTCCRRSWVPVEDTVLVAPHQRTRQQPPRHVHAIPPPPRGPQVRRRPATLRRPGRGRRWHGVGCGGHRVQSSPVATILATSSSRIVSTSCGARTVAC